MSHRSRMMILGSLFALASTPASSQAGVFYQQTNLVSNRSDVGAAHIDPNLRNPWGISSSPTSPFWVSNQVTGTATLYDGAGTPQALVVMIPPSPSGGNPTGQVFNPTADFVLPTGGKAFFLFATLNGTITGWNPGSGTTAQIAATVPQAVYTGLALGNNNSGNFLYAANSDGATINVFNASFAPASLGGSFVDPNLPSGFTPYNIQNLNGTLYVTYEHEGVGGGVVNAGCVPKKGLIKLH